MLDVHDDDVRKEGRRVEGEELGVGDSVIVSGL